MLNIDSFCIYYDSIIIGLLENLLLVYQKTQIILLLKPILGEEIL